jgi:hypothetical protein
MTAKPKKIQTKTQQINESIPKSTMTLKTKQIVFF